MTRRNTIGALCVLALIAPAPASADQLSISPPAAPPPEDAAFALGFSGSTGPRTSGYEAELHARIRPAGGVPCAPTSDTDAGSSILSRDLGRAGGNFQATATYTPDTAGEYLVCAWIEEFLTDALFAGPVSATVTVRLPTLSINMRAPSRARPGATFPVSVDFLAEVPRYLAVVFAQASGCGVNLAALRDSSTHFDAFVNSEEVSGAGRFDKTVTAPGKTGAFLLCGYFRTSFFDSNTAAQLVVTGPGVQIGVTTTVRRCADVGGRKRITEVRVTRISCARGRSVARRWGRGRRAPRTVSGLRCRRGANRHVTCAGGAGKVRFRYRR